MNQQIRRMNVQNGQGPMPNKPLPRSIRTTFIAGGQTFAVDEDIHVFSKKKNEFLADESQQDLWLTADHRPICFARELVKLFAFATTFDRGNIETVEEPEAVRRINRGG